MQRKSLFIPTIAPSISIMSIYATPKYHFLSKAVGDKPFRLLDVGSGNHSPSKTTRLFPGCEYHGMDMSMDYGYDDTDKAALKGFYDNDLTKLEFNSIPNNYFDFLMMAHIIEHLTNGDQVIAALSKKLKSGGHIYIEYPGQKSTKLPSMHGTLNFYDDNTHVRVYSVSELKKLLEGLGFKVISAGTRRRWLYIFAIPVRAAALWLRGKKLHANVLWDLLGFAEYLYAVKK